MLVETSPVQGTFNPWVLSVRLNPNSWEMYNISIMHTHAHMYSVLPRDTGEPGGCEDMSSSSDDSDVEWEDVGPGEKSEDFLQEHGFASRGYTIPVEIPSSSHVNVTETEDNSSILATLREAHHLLTDKYLPVITRWMEVGRQG